MMPPPPCLVSLHDVMPETMDRAERILAHLHSLGLPPITLLVVPGRPWAPHQLEQLRTWSAAGHRLAPHGWRHTVAEIRGLRHRVHSLLISRRVAEHLALESAGIRQLMSDGCEWFAHQGLPAPSLYVPPAWALGPIRRPDLARLPFRQIEVTRGLLAPQSGRLRPLPVVGFEADTALRATVLRAWNGGQLRRARRRGVPFRLSIHPFDFELRLRAQLEAMLRMEWAFIDYDAVALPAG